jgi:hypothetical protein
MYDFAQDRLLVSYNTVLYNLFPIFCIILLQISPFKQTSL